MTKNGKDDAAPGTLMFKILALREEVDRVASRLHGKGGVFGPLSLTLPRLEPAELGFMRAVSWLYVLYYEVGKVGSRFLLERIAVYCSIDQGEHDRHFLLVGGLRTYLQHNLDPFKSHDRTVQDGCEGWFEASCGTRVPGTDSQWNECLLQLLNEAAGFLSELLEVVRGIEADSSRSVVVAELVDRLERYHPPVQFDELIEVVCREMGRDAIDPAVLRRRFYDKWIAELQLLNPKYDFAVEARRLIEHALLTATIPVLPITGVDVMKRFALSPGPKVGELLTRARRLYDEHPCSAEELLDKLT